MRTLTGLLYWFCWWLFRPMLWWIKYRVAPADLKTELNLDPDKPICFVIPARSWGDVFVLERICRDAGLPRPRRSGLELPAVGKPACLYLPALEQRTQAAEELEHLMRTALDAEDYDVQLVPVSIFWGRDPGKETSLFRIMFSDSTQAGAFRKLLIMLANGRQVFGSFGQPVSFREYMGRHTDARRAMIKLARGFNVHFLRSRTATLGPTLLRRNTVIQGLLNSPGVRLAIEREAKETEQTIEKVRARARKCAEEIAADYSSAAINFLERTLTYVWNRVYAGVDVRGMERVRQWAQSHEIIYLPSHRSHADYLLVSYVLFQSGLVPPHIAAGNNLNMPVVGGLLRRCGAFFMRRKFSGDKLYTQIFRAYVDSLIQRGYSISFYPEGGRSRTGRLLQPKAGLLSMVVESALRQKTQKVAVVPVYIGYDKVWEINSYLKELRGAKKKKESVQGLLKATRILGQNYGKPYVNFGEPMRLQDWAEEQIPGWRNQMGTEAEPQRPADFPKHIDQLAVRLMQRINQCAVVSPVALTSVALLSTPQKAIGEADLNAELGHLLRLLRGNPYSPEQVIPVDEPKALLEWAAPIAGLSRISHAWGDVLVAEDRAAVGMTYYRNNIQHLFAVPSLIANFFRTRFHLTEEAVLNGCRALYPFLRTEFFLRWNAEQAEAQFKRWIEVMLEVGLLQREEDNRLRRPDLSAPEFSTLAALARIMGETLERYCMTTLMLAEQSGAGPFERSAFEADCGTLAERIAVLTGRNAPEFFDKALFRGYVNTLIEAGVLHQRDGGLLEVDAKIERIAERAMDLLSAEAQQTILQLLARRRRERLGQTNGAGD